MSKSVCCFLVDVNLPPTKQDAQGLHIKCRHSTINLEVDRARW